MEEVKNIPYNIQKMSITNWHFEVWLKITKITPKEARNSLLLFMALFYKVIFNHTLQVYLKRNYTVLTSERIQKIIKCSETAIKNDREYAIH